MSAIPSVHEPFLDDDGHVTPTWFRFLSSLSPAANPTGTANQVLHGGVSPSWAPVAPADMTDGTAVQVLHGTGTGTPAYAQIAFSDFAAGPSATVLRSNAGAVTWDKVNLGADVTNLLSTTKLTGNIVIDAVSVSSNVKRLILLPQTYFEGDFSNATIANRSFLRTSAANSPSRVGVIPTGASTTSELDVISDSAATNYTVGSISTDGTQVVVTAGKAGTATAPPLVFSLTSGEAARFQPSGIFQITNACAFRVNKGGTNQALTDGAAPALITFNTVVFDQDANYNTGTNRLTPKAGKYWLAACLVNIGSVNLANWAVWIYKNGAVHLSGSILTCSGTTVGGSYVGGAVDANGTDYFQVFAQSTNGGGVGMTVSGLANDAYFTGHRIG